MNDRAHEQMRVDLGAYVLGQLPEDESAALEAHLDGCAECTAELGELTPVAAALGELRAHGSGTAPDAPPPDLGDRVVAAVTDSARVAQRRSRWRTAAVAGAAAAVVLVGAVAVQSLRADETPAVPLEVVDVQVDEPGLRASADLVNHTWGVEVKLHASGFDRGGRYRVAVLGVDGTRYPAGEFVGTGSRTMDCNLNSSVLRDRATGFEVLDPAGDVVASSAFG